jgi:membrane dipeptidase
MIGMQARTIISAGALVLSGGLLFSNGAPAERTARPGGRQPPAFVMDAHTHMINRQLYLGGDIGDSYQDGQVDLPRIRAGGLNAIFFSLYSLEPYYPHRYELKHTLQLLELALQQIEKHQDQIELALNASDIERIAGQGKIAALLDLEGAYDLDGDLLALQALYRLGLRSLMLPAHNQHSNFADSCCEVPRWNGINDRGRELIREMNRLGMIINVAHGSTETILQAVEASDDPVLYSHGGYRHIVNIPRNISDEAARAIAAKGGVIGHQIGNSMNNPRDFARRQEEARRQGTAPGLLTTLAAPSRSSPPPIAFDELNRQMASRQPGGPRAVPPDIRMTVDELVEVIDYAVQLVGEDHVAIGADFDGGVPPPHGIEDISDYGKITDGLVRKGYGQERISKIMGLNLLRLIRDVTEKSSR